MRGSANALGRAGLVALAVLLLDQLTKVLVRAEIAPGEQIELLAGVQLVRVGNEGIAFGLLDDAGAAVVLLAAGGFVVLLGYFAATTEREGLWLPVGLLAGGALGNLIDRVNEGAVTDFIDPPSWPAFNFADVAITAGVALLLLVYLRDPADGEASEGRSA